MVESLWVAQYVFIEKQVDFCNIWTHTSYTYGSSITISKRNCVFYIFSQFHELESLVSFLILKTSALDSTAT